jgi:hypothetical protein
MAVGFDANLSGLGFPSANHRRSNVQDHEWQNFLWGRRIPPVILFASKKAASRSPPPCSIRIVVYDWRSYSGLGSGLRSPSLFIRSAAICSRSPCTCDPCVRNEREDDTYDSRCDKAPREHWLAYRMGYYLNASAKTYDSHGDKNKPGPNSLEPPVTSVVLADFRLHGRQS